MEKFNNGFVLTMAFNEQDALPIWYNHYSRYFNSSSMYVIDHGSNKNYVPEGVNRIYVPRYKGFNEDCRRDSVEGLSHTLMQYYDFGVYCDADELLILDGFNAGALELDAHLFVHGFNLFKVSVLGVDRVYGLLSYGMCKPLVFNKLQPRWSSGFHGARIDTAPVMSMVMGHTKFFDVDLYQRNIANRVEAYNSMQQHQKEFGMNIHWVDPHTLPNVYKEVQEAIDQNCLRLDVHEYAPVWGRDPNGYVVAKDTGEPFLLDLTEQFGHLL